MRQIFITGLALFSMFFGAGNLIFPLLIGKEVGAEAWPAIFGLLITAVIVPFLGLFAMILYKGDTRRFFGEIGRIPGFLLFLFLQLILGPMGVIPRLVTLMHALAKPYLWDISIGWFSVLAALVIFACSYQRQKLIPFLGKILTPVLLLSLGALFYFGLQGGELSPEVASDSFMKGLMGGYNTMDLIAAFLFATVILPHFKGDKKKIFYSSILAASLLFVIYIGLCWISAYHGWKLDVAPEQLLSAIAYKLLGPKGGCIAAIAIITACLTTAITLVSIFADYLRKEIYTMSPNASLIVTLGITSLFANLGFGGIAAILNPILQVVYPGLIVLTLYNLRKGLLQSAESVSS